MTDREASFPSRAVIHLNVPPIRHHPVENVNELVNG